MRCQLEVCRTLQYQNCYTCMCEIFNKFQWSAFYTGQISPSLHVTVKVENKTLILNVINLSISWRDYFDKFITWSALLWHTNVGHKDLVRPQKVPSHTEEKVNGPKRHIYQYHEVHMCLIDCKSQINMQRNECKPSGS